MILGETPGKLGWTVETEAERARAAIEQEYRSQHRARREGRKKMSSRSIRAP